MIEITTDEAESLMNWMEIDFIESIKNDPDCDSMEWLVNMCNIYSKCKAAVEQGDR